MHIPENKIKQVLNAAQNKKILIIGDVILDKYIWGAVSRISPEAPIPVVEIEREEYVPGGASNVAQNIKDLGAVPLLVGYIGTDKTIISQSLTDRQIDPQHLIIDQNSKTTEKIRVIAQQQQLVRIDYESKQEQALNAQPLLLEKIEALLTPQNCAGVIISDYNKGVLNNEVCQTVISLCNKYNLPVGIDPKPANTSFYKDASFLTPNHFEAAKMAKIDEKTQEDVLAMGAQLQTSLNANLIITRGKDGMMVFEKNQPPQSIPTKAVDVFDVTGAGDTVIATILLALIGGASYLEAAVIANYAASVVINKFGAATANLEEIITRYHLVEGQI
jgi:D-beta-D-heptose 7-phosphate kinase/D-beta-D-heptose 1-phosphate adenosyltransferase